LVHSVLMIGELSFWHISQGLDIGMITCNDCWNGEMIMLAILH
jgi:hypothetical protein